MSILNLVLVLLLQTPEIGQKVVVGLGDGQQIVMQDPEFTGFIEGKNGDAAPQRLRRKNHLRV